MIPALRLQNLGPYRLGERLGVGGMAEVFAADCERFGQVALKRILPGLAEDAGFADMFWDEARITSRLDHPNIVKILDYGRVDEQLYMALEYVQGPTLARVLRKAAKVKERFDFRVLVAMMVELLDALHYVHSAQDERGVSLDIVHRDVSPGNVMMTPHGHVKLGDFGIVRSQAVMRRTQPGELKGKIGYMSPEQALGEPVTHLSDIFAVGIIMAEFLTLRPLFLGKNEMQTLSRTVSVDLSTWHRYNQYVPLALRSIVEGALRREPKERFQSAGAMRAALLEVARAAGWGLSSTDVVNELRVLDLLPAEEERSGERRVVSPKHLDATQTQGRTAMGGLALELPTVVQELGTPRRPQGKPVWNVSYTPLTLPMQLFSALRRTFDGVVELSSAGELISIELFQGRVLAAHDSTGVMPLGRMLQEASLVSAGQLAKAIGESRRANLRLGEYLVLERRLRESTLARLLRQQTEARLSRWFSGGDGELAIFVDARSPRERDVEPPSTATLVSAMRKGISHDSLAQYLGSVADAVVLPSRGAAPTSLALTDPEVRVLQTTMEGGSYEGRSVRTVIESVERERIARRGEAMFALFVALSAGVIHAPGFGR